MEVECTDCNFRCRLDDDLVRPNFMANEQSLCNLLGVNEVIIICNFFSGLFILIYNFKCLYQLTKILVFNYVATNWIMNITRAFACILLRSHVLGQFMPLVGMDWTQSGVAKLFSAIKVYIHT